MDFNYFLLISSLLLLLSMLFNKVAQKFALPSLIVFIFVGVLAGFKINFSNFNLAQNIGIISISFILFMGGLSVDFSEIKPVLKEGFALATFGVLITALVTGGLAYFAINLPLKECFLLAVILSSTDAAAVFGILRNKNIVLKNNLKPLLEFESGSNDPMAVFLTLSVILIILGNLNIKFLLLDFFKQMFIALFLGNLIARVFVFIINKIKLSYDNLYTVLTITLVLFTYSTVSIIGANGFMAVYMAGLTLAKSELAHKKNLIRFHDTLAWLFQIVMFLILGLLINLKESFNYIPQAVICSLILIFVARPVAVFLTDSFFNRNLKEKLLISWVGLRGAAPIVLAIFPLTYNINYGFEIFNIIFYVVIISLILQGTTVSYVAKLLKLNEKNISKHSSVLEYSDLESKNKIIEFKIPPDVFACNKRIDELNLPNNSIVSLIYKKGEYIIPKNDTIVEQNDILFVLMDKTKENMVRKRICSKFDK